MNDRSSFLLDIGDNEGVYTDVRSSFLLDIGDNEGVYTDVRELVENEQENLKCPMEGSVENTAYMSFEETITGVPPQKHLLEKEERKRKSRIHQYEEVDIDDEGVNMSGSLLVRQSNKQGKNKRNSYEEINIEEGAVSLVTSPILNVSRIESHYAVQTINLPQQLSQHIEQDTTASSNNQSESLLRFIQSPYSGSKVSRQRAKSAIDTNIKCDENEDLHTRQRPPRNSYYNVQCVFDANLDTAGYRSFTSAVKSNDISPNCAFSVENAVDLSGSISTLSIHDEADAPTLPNRSGGLLLDSCKEPSNSKGRIHEKQKLTVDIEGETGTNKTKISHTNIDMNKDTYSKAIYDSSSITVLSVNSEEWDTEEGSPTYRDFGFDDHDEVKSREVYEIVEMNRELKETASHNVQASSFQTYEDVEMSETQSTPVPAKQDKAKVDMKDLGNDNPKRPVPKPRHNLNQKEKDIKSEISKISANKEIDEHPVYFEFASECAGMEANSSIGSIVVQEEINTDDNQYYLDLTADGHDIDGMKQVLTKVDIKKKKVPTATLR